MNKECIIIVPIYKQTPDILDKLSLGQLKKVLASDYRIMFVIPEGLDTSEYKELIDFDVTEFDPKYFKSIESYSFLCLNYNFYSTFKDYEYMLIYQTDCWVFKNTLSEWCKKGYDYIGAPIYARGSQWPSLQRTGKPVVGNGGLSLRKISTMMRITDPEGYVAKRYSDSKFEQFKKFEDLFITDIVAHDIYINIPDYKIAEQFSYDCLPINFKPAAVKDNLFGCHRVFTYGVVWREIIDELNDSDVFVLCEEKFQKEIYNHNDKNKKKHYMIKEQTKEQK